MAESYSKSPLDSKRSSTDGNFIFVFVFILFVWAALVLHAFIAVYDSSLYQEAWTAIDNYFRDCYVAALISISLSIVSLMILVLMMKCIPRFFIWIGIICTVITIVGIIFRMIMAIISTANSGFWYYMLRISILSIYLAFTIPLLLCIKKIGMTPIANVIAKTSEAFFECFRTILITLIATILVVVVAFITILCAGCEQNAKGLMILFGGYYISYFIHYLGKMIVSPTIAIRYWSENKSAAQEKLMYQNYSEIFKNHCGSAAYAALPILPFCKALGEVCSPRTRINRSHSNPLINFVLAVNFIWSNAGLSSSFISIFGVGFRQSTTGTFKLLFSNSPLSLGFSMIFNIILAVLVSVISVLSMVSVPLFTSVMTQYELDEVNVLRITGAFLIIIFMIPFITYMDLIAQVNLLCTLKDEEDDKSPEERAQQMNIVPGTHV